MTWHVHYYHVKNEETILNWPKKLLAKYLRIIDIMEEQGPDLGMPFTRPMGGGLFEIRVKAQEGIARAFFCIQHGKEIMILHAFIKKTEKTPKKDLSIAKRHLKELSL